MGITLHDFDFQEDEDISAYIYERTLKMEERTKLLSAMHMKKREVRTINTFITWHRVSIESRSMCRCLG